jgi:hypothetical protein
MKRWLAVAVAALLAGAAALVVHLRRRAAAGGPVVHVENSFAFTIEAPFQDVVPLFGGSSERHWGGGQWDPEFLYPRPERDAPGEVFVVRHGHASSTWVNTHYDLLRGRFEYAMFIPDVQVAVVDVQVTSEAPSRTRVDVVYRRTALDPAHNRHVEHLGARDRESGPQWSEAITAYLRIRPRDG